MTSCKNISRFVFSDEIMATTFSVHVDATQGDAERVQAVAEEVFSQIKHLESLFSFYREDSEISQINRLKKGESLRISPETFQCLTCAIAAWKKTQGHFDAAFRSDDFGSFAGYIDSEETLTPAENLYLAAPLFSLHKKPLRVISNSESLKIDLGGIGKGFSLDFVKETLLYHGYPRSLLCASTSTILALDSPFGEDGWKLVLETDSGEKSVSLKNMAISCSGKSARGEHIFDITQKEFRTVSQRIWVQAKTATFADAFSTGCITMTSTRLSEMTKKNTADKFLFIPQ
ncbi:MAG: FAD:protein FMN transferase [Thermoguttaceae bacterium]